LRSPGNRFLLSSTTFSPALFLSQVHRDASTQSLLQGLDTLSRSIDQKSASLKVLVESNFERFVRAKATIDNVYTAMKNQGAERDWRVSNPRLTGRASYRGSGGAPQTPMVPSPSIGSKKKHALLKESDYGTMGIKAPLIEVSAKAEEAWGPALGGREREEDLKIFATAMERYKGIYEINGAISDSIRRKDYESLIEEYARAKRFAENAKRIADSLTETKLPPSDTQVQQLVVAARMWRDVEEQIDGFKREIWRRLIAIQYNAPKAGSAFHEQHMELIGILLELGVQDNPIWVWLLSRYDHLKNKIQATADRSRVEIEILRRRLASGSRPSSQSIALHFRSLSRLGVKDIPTNIDSPEVIELWERVYSFLNSMLSPQGILGELTEFWQTVQGFIDGKTQRTLPVGLNGESRHHHRLSDQGTVDLQKGTIELIDMIRENVFAFFVDLPVEDISSLFSPITATPGGSPRSVPTPGRLQDPRFTFDSNNPPPPSPRLGETWEKFAFWPPWSNALSGVHYLSKFLVLIGSGASEMAAVSIVGRGDGSALERLRGLVGGARERCVVAICGAWNSDAENIKVLEDWKRSPDKKDITNMPRNFYAFQTAILVGMQKILYISEAMAKSGSVDVVLPPPAKLLQMVRSQYATTMYKALSGMVENAERPLRLANDDWTTEDNNISGPASIISATNIGADTVNASDRVSALVL
jgi:exocyst complex component 2